MDKGCIDQVLKEKICQCFGYVFKEKYLGKKIPKVYKKGTKQVCLLDPKTLKVIQYFNSVTEAAKFLKCSTTNISKACKNINKIVKGFKVKYKEDNQDENS